MDKEVHQIHHESFDYIVLTLSLIGLVGGGFAFILEGPTSLWFLRSIALLAVVLVAFVLRQAGQFRVAAYVLALELIGLVAGAFLQTDTFSSFIPYLFIPIIIIASLIIGPYAPLVLAIFSILLVLVIIAVTGQLTHANLSTLLPSFTLTLLTTLMAALSGRHSVRIDNRLLDSNKLLRQRTLELLKVLEEAKQLQAQAQELKEQVRSARIETSPTQQVTVQSDNRFYLLMNGTIQGLKASLKKLEQMTETMVGVSNPLLPQVWQEIDHLTGLVINLEELAEVENGEIQLAYQPIDLAQLLNELVQTGRGLARQKNLELRYLAADNLPALKADPARLRQALLHLLGNAIAYTNQGLIEVQTELTERELTIFISDTGSGILPEELERVFQNSGRQQSAPVQQRSGSGLGLPLSQRIIEKHGGRLWATSVVGVGSTFCIALPLSADPEATQLRLSAVTLPALVAPSREITFMATDPAETKVIPPLAGEITPQLPPPHSYTPLLDQTQVNLGPVARFSPVYIGRFGLTLLSLLMLISVLVLVLALTNGLNLSQAQIAQVTPIVSPRLGPDNVTPPKTPSPVETTVPIAPAVPSTTPSPTQAQPSPTATVLIVTRVPVESTPLAETLPSPTPTTQPTRTPLPSPTSSPTPQPSPTPTATQTAAARPQPVSQVVEPGVAAPARLPTAAFVFDPQNYPALTSLGFQTIPHTQLSVVSNPAAGSGLSWLRTASGYQALFSDDVATSDRELYLAPGDGSPLVNLTQAAGDDLQPAVSPDNSRIAFSSGRSGNLDIYVINASGDNLTQLTTNLGYDEWPAWSPDGRQLAFVSDRDGNVEIYLMNGDGSQQQRLTNNPADDWPVVWSPDGQTLLFASNRDGNWNLYLLELLSKNLTRLTDDSGDEREPAWSPDGRTIAFAYNHGSNWDIYSLPAPTSPSTAIPRSQWTQLSTRSRDERYPAWLP